MIEIIALIIVIIGIGLREEEVKDLYGYDSYNDDIEII